MSEAAGKAVAVLDVGKTNIKLNLVSPDGRVVETRSTPNAVVRDGLWRRHDLAGTEAWLLAQLAALCARHDIGSFIASGHGSAGVLVRQAEIEDPEPALPMIDYEQDLPEDVRRVYAEQAGPFFDRGSAFMLGATHQARQMVWVERERPSDFAAAEAFLGVPQYWAWRLSGVPCAEFSYLGAQSHLWNVPERRHADIVRRRGWERLMPAIRHAGDALGPVRPAVARRHGLPPGLRIHAGLHDSSANFFRYQSAGLEDFTLVSTGTWIVALAQGADLSRLDEHRGMTCNSDLDGRPLGGCLTMGGREFSSVAGEQAEGATADPALVSGLVEAGRMALPSFNEDDGLFPGSGARGRYEGAAPATAAERLALAVLYAALLTCECVLALGEAERVVLDGSFVRDPVYCRLVAGLLPGSAVFVNRGGDGIASGAALAIGAANGRASPAMPLERAIPLSPPGLSTYAARWRRLAHLQEEPRK